MNGIAREEIWVHDEPHKPKLDEGIHDAVILTVEDLGTVDTGKFGVKDMVKITFGVDSVELPKRFNKSLRPTSALYDLVFKVSGAPPTRPFDVKILEDKECQILTEHSNPTESGDVWDNIVKVLRPTQPNFKDNFEDADN